MLEYLNSDVIPVFIVIFREILEIAIILGVVMVAAKELEQRNKWILIGLGAGVFGSLVVAFFAQAISNAAEGLGQELFNAIILLSASAVIGATALWMSKHAGELTAHLRHVSNEVIEGNLPLYTIAVVIALAVLREGAEIVLFTHGMMASGKEMSSIISGAVLGLFAGTILGGAMYFGLLKISPKHVFGVTTWLLMFLCAGMSASAAKYLASAGWFESMAFTVWDSSFILSNESLLGQIIHALFGYTAKPYAIQLVFYIGTLVILFAAKQFINRKSAEDKNAVTGTA
ncbi:MAG: iron permease [Alphaproteobacteria bacterium CG11_big_fil_rev_8_21_14_0_20_39_49]|nr:MAG: iron permease [Alphaproteobacteria bacterium CG11_big_fil_rev_8_21_14_0_20_39_49]